jgi:thiol-disulfide isomerase/thioredoxin
MPLKILIVYIVVQIMMVMPAYAEKEQLKPFVSGSYQHLLKENDDRPFMLAIWSITCTTCMEKMALLNELQRNRPDLNIVMLATDDVSIADQIQKVLAKNQLTDLMEWTLTSLYGIRVPK